MSKEDTLSTIDVYLIRELRARKLGSEASALLRAYYFDKKREKKQIMKEQKRIEGRRYRWRKKRRLHSQNR